MHLFREFAVQALLYTTPTLGKVIFNVGMKDYSDIKLALLRCQCTSLGFSGLQNADLIRERVLRVLVS